MAEPASPTLDARRAQTFPVLAPDEIARMRRFGTPCRYAAGARIYETGKPSPGMLVVLSGAIRITGRDGHGHDFPVVDHVAGAFSGELGQLSSRRSLVDAVAVGDVDALLISPEHRHARCGLRREVVDRVKQDYSDLRVININGHTGRLGGAQYNQRLSERRAEAVRNYLVSRGFDGSKIETYGYGKTMPVKSCPDQKNRKAVIECLTPNRRVDIEVQGTRR